MSLIISLTGDLGSGKSTVSSILCKTLGYEYLYTGQIQRKIAERYAMTTNELNIYAETHPEIDKEIDDTFKSLVNAKNIIVDSRMAWFFIPNSFKVFLKTNIVISAKRISGDRERINENYVSMQEAALKIAERKKSEVKRYKQYYNVDCLDLTNYNLIIDTTEISPSDVCQIIIDEFDCFSSNPEHYNRKAFVCPKNLYPTKMSDDSSSIEVTNNDSFDYIIRGHNLVAKGIKDNQHIVQVKYLNEKIFPNKNIIEEWQKVNNFKYLIQPYS